MSGIWKKTNKIYDLCGKDSTYFFSYWNENFRLEILRLLKEKEVIDKSFEDLENIHKYVIDKDLLDYDFNSGVNGITKKLYDVDKSFMDVYHSFLKDLHKMFGFNFYFQDTPTIRVHCPNSDKDNHYPMFHNDIILGHPPQEINVWMSLTKNKNTGFWIMSKNDSNKIMSENTKKKIFDLAHGSQKFNQECLNLSKQVESTLDYLFLFNSVRIHSAMQRDKDTRLSMDIRINPVDGFEDGYVGTGMTKAEFRPGGKFGYHKSSIRDLIDV